MAASEAPICGETCRSISPSRGRMLGSVFAIAGGKACHSCGFRQFQLVLVLVIVRNSIDRSRSRTRAVTTPVCDHRFDVGKIIHDTVRLMLGQLLARKTSGRDRNRARADRFAARDIVRRVADDIDLRGREIDRVFSRAPAVAQTARARCDRDDRRQTRQTRKNPRSVMRELQFRAALQVAGEQAENVLRPRPQTRQ